MAATPTAPKGSATIELEDVRQNRGLASNLGGTCVAILTFLLFFLYPRAIAGQLNPILFRVAVGTIVITMFLFVFASIDYYWFLRTFRDDSNRAKNYVTRADRLTGMGILLLVLSPSLILFTVDVLDLAFLAFGLWLLVVSMVLFGWRKFGF